MRQTHDADLDLVARGVAANRGVLSGAERGGHGDVEDPGSVGMALVMLVGEDLAGVDRAAAAKRDDHVGADLVDQVEAGLDVLDRAMLADLPVSEFTELDAPC